MNAQDILNAYECNYLHTSTSLNINVIARRLTGGPNGSKLIRKYWATGLGKSALVAQKFVGTARSLGIEAQFIHPVDGLHGDVGAMRNGQVLVAVSASGRTEEVQIMAHAAKSRGLEVVSITELKPNPLSLIAGSNLYSAATSWDPGHIPSASFGSACALADALAVALAGEEAELDHPGGEIGKLLST